MDRILKGRILKDLILKDRILMDRILMGLSRLIHGWCDFSLSSQVKSIQIKSSSFLTRRITKLWLSEKKNNTFLSFGPAYSYMYMMFIFSIKETKIISLILTYHSYNITIRKHTFILEYLKINV